MRRSIGFTLVGLSMVMVYFFAFTEDGQAFGYNFTFAMRTMMNL
jgi:hypothetical protein